MCLAWSRTWALGRERTNLHPVAARNMFYIHLSPTRHARQSWWSSTQRQSCRFLADHHQPILGGYSDGIWVASTGRGVLSDAHLSLAAV